MRNMSFLILILMITIISAIDNCLEFDGTDDYIQLPVSSDFDYSGISEMTFEAWLYYTGSSTYTGVFGKYPSAAGVVEYDLFIDHEHKILLGFNKLGTGWQYTVRSNDVIETNRWFHLAIVKTATDVTMYIDGIEESYSTLNATTISASTSTGTTRIGKSSNGFNSNFEGKMDEVRIWGDARTVGEIRKNMYTELSGSEADLIAYYKINAESGSALTDESSNTNNATLENMADDDWIESDAFMHSDYCLDFDGINDMIEAPQSADFEMQTFTIETWMKLSPTAGTRNSIVSYGYGSLIGGTEADESFVLTYRTDSGGRFRVRLKNSSSVGFIDFFQLFPTDSILGKWVHVAAVWTGTTLEIYTNGNLLGNTSNADIINYSVDAKLRIGNWFGNNERWFKGQLDDIRIWNDARTLEEIRENMYREISGDEANLVANYKMNHPAISTVCYDGIGNHDGSYIGSMTDDDRLPSGAGSGAGNCVAYDGSDDYTDCGTIGGASNTITVEAWIKTPASWSEEPYPQIVSRATGNLDGYNLYIYEANTESRKFSFIILRDGGSWGSDWVLSDIPIETDTWYHLAGVREADNTIKIYVNGIMTESSGSSGNIVYGSSPHTYIGRKSNGAYFEGMIDEVRFWEDARTKEEIWENMCKSLTGFEPNLLTYFNLNESDAATAYNLVDNNSGTHQLFVSEDLHQISTAFTIWIGTNYDSWNSNYSWSDYFPNSAAHNATIPNEFVTPTISGDYSVNILVVPDAKTIDLTSGNLSVNNLYLMSSATAEGNGNITIKENAYTINTHRLIVGGDGAQFSSMPLLQ